MDVSIDYNKMFKEMKAKLTEEPKTINFRLFFNSINNKQLGIILDLTQNTSWLGCSIDFTTYLKNYNKVTQSYNLIVIKEDSNTLINYPQLAVHIKENDKLSQIFFVNDSTVKKCLQKYSFLFVSTESAEKERLFSQMSLPLLVLEDELFVGSAIHLSCKPLLASLGIKEVLEIGKNDSETHTVFQYDEQSKPEIEFEPILEAMTAAAKPLLVSCLTGNSLSIAVAIAYLIKVKGQNLFYSTAVVMKSKPDFKLEPWLYNQIQKL